MTVMAVNGTGDLKEVRPGSRFGPPDDSYEIGEELGSGAAARVYRCRRLQTDEASAVKVINLSRLSMGGDVDTQMEKINREVDILSKLRHPRIVNLNCVHRTPGWCFIVMEYVSGGELFHHILENKTLHELEAIYIFRQLLEGLSYMHSKGVIHRDLKAENILIASTQTYSHEGLELKLRDVKIADFGLSKVVYDGQSVAKTFVGTPQYWAPEVLAVQRGGGGYDCAADLWSLGAVLFVMLCGRYPFDGKKMPLEVQIQSAAINMSSQAWQNVSEPGKDLIRGLLRVNRYERYTLEDCRRHPWVASTAGAPILELESRLGPTVVDVSATPVHAADKPSPVPVVTQPSQASDLSNQSESVDMGTASSVEHADKNVDVKQQQLQGQAAQEQHTIFCLQELLKLQVSIAGSLEMACLAFRHTDPELSEAIRRTFNEAKNVSSGAAKVVSQYSEVASRVSQSVLPDLKLAVQEKEPSLAVTLLGMVKDWVQKMKEGGEQMQGDYRQLQKSVHDLITQAQRTKAKADRQILEANWSASPSVSSQGVLALGPPMPEADRARGRTASDSSPESAGSAPRQEPVNTHRSPAAVVSTALATRGPMNSHPTFMNLWTKQLFERLGRVKAGEMDVQETAIMSAMDTSHGNEKEQDEAWKHDVLELLFMSPGASSSQLPKVESVHTPVPEAAAGPASNAAACTDGDSDVQMGDSGGAASKAAETCSNEDTETPAPMATEPVTRNPAAPEPSSQQLQLIVQQPNNQATAEAILNASNLSLLRALRELKRVDEILQGCCEFWSNMDGTVEKLAQMKEHTECLVNFAANSKALRERFDQRLGEYADFWSSLERLCTTYVQDHQAASNRMYAMIRDISDTTDMMDTIGMIAAAKEKYRRRGYQTHY